MQTHKLCRLCSFGITQRWVVLYDALRNQVIELRQCQRVKYSQQLFPITSEDHQGSHGELR